MKSVNAQAASSGHILIPSDLKFREAQTVVQVQLCGWKITYER